MVGPRRSVIGVEVEPVIQRYLDALPRRAETAADPTIQFNAVLADVDEASGRARAVARLDRTVTLGQP